MTLQEYDTILVTEETISPEEFLKRRKEGKISAEKVRIAFPEHDLPFGGFKVELDTPIYTVPFEKRKKNVFG